MKIDYSIIDDIIEVSKRMDEKGLVNAYEGNVSVLRDGLLYITPSGKNKAKYDRNYICVFDENGNQISGDFRPSSELPMHSAVYKMRDNIGGVVHAHPDFLTAYAMCGKPFETKCHAEMLWDHKSVEVAEYGRPGSEDIVKGVKPVLDKGRDVVLLANHGVLSVGTDVFAAMNKLESVEHAAKIITIAKIVGDGKYADLPEDEIRLLLSL